MNFSTINTSAGSAETQLVRGGTADTSPGSAETQIVRGGTVDTSPGSAETQGGGNYLPASAR